jgi:hypothetical protein
MRGPWEKPMEANHLTPARVRRGLRNLCTKTVLVDVRTVQGGWRAPG